MATPTRQSPGGGTTAPRPALAVRLLPELAGLVLCAVLLVGTLDLDTNAGGPGPAFYPRLLIALLSIALLVRVVQQLRDHRRPDTPPAASGGEPSDFDPETISDGRVWAVVAMTIAYVLATIVCGWPIATALFVIGFCWAAGKRNLLVVVPVGLVTSLAFTYVFVKVVYMALPTGIGVFDSATVALFGLLGIY